MRNHNQCTPPSTSHNTLYSQTPADGDVKEGSEETYFSPNRPLDEDELADYALENIDKETEVQASTNEYSFFDEATIYVRAGSGGQGSSTFKKGKLFL